MQSAPMQHRIPAETVPVTGIYSTHHGGEHFPYHELVLIANDKFPACEICNEDVRYRLVRSAPHILEDTDFNDEDGS